MKCCLGPKAALIGCCGTGGVSKNALACFTLMRLLWLLVMVLLLSATSPRLPFRVRLFRDTQLDSM